MNELLTQSYQLLIHLFSYFSWLVSYRFSTPRFIVVLFFFKICLWFTYHIFPSFCICYYYFRSFTLFCFILSIIYFISIELLDFLGNYLYKSGNTGDYSFMYDCMNYGVFFWPFLRRDFYPRNSCFGYLVYQKSIIASYFILSLFFHCYLYYLFIFCSYMISWWCFCPQISHFFGHYALSHYFIIYNLVHYNLHQSNSVGVN